MVVAIMECWVSVVYIVDWFQEHLGCSISTASPVDVCVPHPGSKTVGIHDDICLVFPSGYRKPARFAAMGSAGMGMGLGA